MLKSCRRLPAIPHQVPYSNAASKGPEGDQDPGRDDRLDQEAAAADASPVVQLLSKECEGEATPDQAGPPPHPWQAARANAVCPGPRRCG
eukprot:3860690-Prorocentrum_lima.AAC.1